MSAFRTVVLVCDHDVTGPCHARRVTSQTTKAKAREEAELYGWKSCGDRDRCKDHDFPAPIRQVPRSNEQGPSDAATP